MNTTCWQFVPLGWPCLTQSEWASWVQAIGSIAAILIAIAVPAIQYGLAECRRQREHLDRARSLGLRLLPSIQACAESNNAVWDREHPDDHVEDIGENMCIVGVATKCALVIPTELLDAAQQLHDLGPAAKGVQRAIFNCCRAQELLMPMPGFEYDPVLGNSPPTITTDKKQFYDLLWDALMGYTETQNRIEAMFKQSTKRKVT